MAYVTREEHREFANIVLENHGAIMRELSAVRGDIRKLETRDVSLPDLVESAVKEEREITLVTNLRKELESVEKKKAFWVSAATTALTLAAGSIITALVLRWLKI